MRPGFPAAGSSRTWSILIEYFYVIALIAMLTSDYRQRLGDRWGGDVRGGGIILDFGRPQARNYGLKPTF
jgi:hypothetical protein